MNVSVNVFLFPCFSCLDICPSSRPSYPPSVHPELDGWMIFFEVYNMSFPPSLRKTPVIIIINDLTFDSDGVRSHFRSILVGCFTPVKVRVFQEDRGEGEGQWWWGGWFDFLKLHPVSAQHQCWGRSSIWVTAKGHVTTLHQLLVWPN